MRKLYGVVLVIGLFSLATASPARAGEKPAWWSYDRPATYEAVKSQVMVPVRDGTPIHCTLALPGEGGAPAAGTFPGLIISYTPYGATQAPAALGGDMWAEHGYASMTCDIRGTGLSGGAYTSLLSAQENDDNYDLLSWMAAQPWSNGVLGQTGVSYGGMTSFRVASLQHPNLKAIAPLYSQDNLYLNDVYSGGIPTTPVTGNTWPTIAVALSGGRVPAALLFAEQSQHPTFDSYWKQIAVSTKYAKITVPTLQIGGWNDTLLPGGAPGNYLGLKSVAKVPDYLIMGPWGHAAESPEPIGTGYLLAWFDHWLMGLPQAPLPSAPVTSYEQPVGAGGGWQELADWPPPSDKTMRLSLAAEGDPATATFTTQPDDTEQSPRADRTLTFETAAVGEDFVLAGRLLVDLKAAVDAADANLKVRMYDVAPDGAATLVTDGELKASHRTSHESPTPITPDKVTEFPIELWPTHWRFRAGHRLRLQLSGGESTQYVPEPGRITVTVSLGPGGTRIDVPIMGNVPSPPDGAPGPPPPESPVPPPLDESPVLTTPGCGARSGLRSTRVTPVGGRHKVRLRFARRSARHVDIDVFQVAANRRVLHERVARFRDAGRSVTWDGRRKNGTPVGDGVFVVRLRAPSAGGRDLRRLALVREQGRFFARGRFERPRSCELLPRAQLDGPVFGGRPHLPLRAAFRLSQRATVKVVVRRGAHVVQRRVLRNLRPHHTHSVLFRNSARRWPRGLYRVTITARAEKSRVTTNLYSERL